MPRWSMPGRALPVKQRSAPFTGLEPADGLHWSVTRRDLGGLCTPEGATPGRKHHARTWALHQGRLDRLGSNQPTDGVCWRTAGVTGMWLSRAAHGKAGHHSGAGCLSQDGRGPAANWPKVEPPTPRRDQEAPTTSGSAQGATVCPCPLRQASFGLPQRWLPCPSPRRESHPPSAATSTPDPGLSRVCP